MAQVRLNEIWAATGGMTDPGDAKYATGWQAEIPTFQDFNYLLNGLDTNIRQLAVKPNFDWEATIAYEPASRVVDGETIYYALTASTNVRPSTDTTGAWSRAPVIGSKPHSAHKNTGMYLFKPGDDNDIAWNSNALTLDDHIPMIFFKSSALSATNNGFLLANIQSNMCIVETQQVGYPDGRSLVLGAPLVHKIMHEANHAQWHVDNPVAPSLPVGTTMLFVQATPPLGWSLDNTNDGRMIHVDSANAGVKGGTHSPISWTHNHGGFTSYMKDTHEENDPDKFGDVRYSAIHKHEIYDDHFTPKYVNTITCIKT